MMKRLLASLMIGVLLLATTLPALPVKVVSAIDGDTTPAGETRYSVTTYNSATGEYTITFSSLPRYVEDKYDPIDCAWYEEKVGSYYSGNNLIIAQVQNTKITVGAPYVDIKGEKLVKATEQKLAVWEPKLFLDGLEIKPVNKAATLLGTDPSNKNYHQNVLEWDYGICKRRIRIIEGSLWDRFYFDANPNAEVQIQHNYTGDLELKLGSAYDALGQPLRVTVVGNTEIVSAEEFARGDIIYPVLIGASPETFYPSMDGRCYHQEVAVTFHTMVIGGGIGGDDDTDYLSIQLNANLTVEDSWKIIWRSLALFDLSGLTGKTITGTTLTLYGSLKLDDLICTPDINIYSSAPANDDAIVAGDYDSLGTTPYATAIAYGDLNIGDPGDPNDFVFNGAGIAAVQAAQGDILRLGIRNANYDVADQLDPNNHDPNWVDGASSYWIAHSRNKGVGYKPKLVVTYAEAPTVTTQAVTSIEETTATGHGNITDTADGNCSAWGVCYNTGGNPTIADSTAAGSGAGGTGNFTANMTSLSPGTKYYVKAYATNNGNTGYGSQVDFTTKPNDPSDLTATAFTGHDLLSVSTVGTTTIHWAQGGTQQRYNFYTAGRYWIWYSDGTNLGFRTSLDGSTWTAFTNVRASTAGYKFSVAFDGDNFHYTYSGSNPGYDVQYRMGQANGDGSITWLAVEQTVLAVDGSHTVHDPHIATDSNGYPWIAYGYTTEATKDTLAYVAKSSTKNGSWTHEVALFTSPYQFSAFTYTRPDHPSAWCVSIPLTGGKMFAIVQTDAGDATGEANMRGRLWTGASWVAEEIVVASASYTHASASMSPVAEGDDIHLTFGHWNPYATNIDTYYTKRTYGVGWSAPISVRLRSSVQQTVTSVDDSGILYSFWFDEPAVKHAYYKMCIAGAWNTDPVDWLTETEAFTGDGNRLSISDKAYDNKIIITFMTLTGSPYKVKAGVFSGAQSGIRISWTKGAGAEKTMVRRKVGSYPTSVADGDQAYFDTGSSFIDTGLDSNTHYYYRAWSYKTGAPNSGYSDGYAEDEEWLGGASPTIVTNAVSDVEETTATFSANVSAINDTSIPTRGFVWDSVSHINPGDTAPSSSDYAFNWTESDSYGTGAFSYNATGLAEGELYYIRGCAKNDNDFWAYGGEVKFLTKPSYPYSLTATPASEQVSLEWVKGSGAGITVIRGKIGGYPASYDSDISIYNGAGTNTIHSGLTNGDHWHYRAWSKVTEEGVTKYSDEFAQADATPAGVPSVTTNSATDIAETSATLNATITNVGDGSVDYRGFVWDTSSLGNPGNVAPASSDYESNWTEYGTYGTGSFSHDISDLQPEINYFFRGCAHNANGWAYGNERVFPIVGGLVLWFQFPINISALITTPTANFTDLSGLGHDATPTFRTDSSDPDVSAAMASFLPVEEAQAPPWVLETERDFWDTENITATGTFTTTPSPTAAPGVAVIEAISAASGTPSQLPYNVIAGFVILAISITGSWFLAKYGSRNLWLKITLVTILMAICVAVRVFDFWMVVFFLIMAIAVALFSRRRSEG